MALNVSGTGSDADGKSMAALGAQQAEADRAAAEEGGLEVDAETMADQVKELQDMRHDKIYQLMDLAESLTNVNGLGDEPASQGYLQAVNESGKSYQKFLGDIDKFLESYIEKLKDAVREYADTDEDAAGKVPNVES